MKDVMFDLETLGTRPGSAIRSVGAALFDPRGDGAGPTFYMNVNPMSCWEAGLTVDAATLAWWDRQSEEAKAATRADRKPIKEVVEMFHRWFRDSGGELIWCQGAGFDEVLWGVAARMVGAATPWKFWNVRCTRTIYHASGVDPRDVPREGTHHSALDDSLHQIKCVQMSFKRLGGGGA
jgi:hypothetical protein